MNKTIHVNHDGRVHVGGNVWASLESIQQAVLEIQNPDLKNDDTPLRHVPGALNLPSPCTCGAQHQQTINSKQEPLKLPTLNYKAADKKPEPEKEKLNKGEQEPLKLPGLFR